MTGYNDRGLQIEKTEVVNAEPMPQLKIDKKEDSRLTRLETVRQEVTAAPTGQPQNSYDQIKIAKITGTYYAYVYFPDENVYKKVALT